MGEKLYSVESAGRFVLVLEVDVDVALLGQRRESFGKGVNFRCGIACVPPQPIADMARRGLNVGRQQGIAFGNAERCVVLSQDRVDFLAEPGFVAEFECGLRSACFVKFRKKKESAE